MGNQRLTNAEFVMELMEFSQYGALAQLFVVDAIEKMASAVSQAGEGELAGMNNGFISAEAWQAVAREIKQKFNQRNNGSLG